jgi:hypothetical protein
VCHGHLWVLLFCPLNVLLLYVRVGCINYIIICVISACIITIIIIYIGYGPWLLLLWYQCLLWVLLVLYILLPLSDLLLLCTWRVAPVSPGLLVSVGILVLLLFVPPLWPSRLLWWPPRWWWALGVFWTCAKKTVQLFQQRVRWLLHFQHYICMGRVFPCYL